MARITKINNSLWCVLIVLSLVTILSMAKSSLMPFDRAKQLQKKGYSTDTAEDIIEATKSQSYYVRYIALDLLAQRIGEKAIPTLKEALNDEKVEVRCNAAHLLGTLGDKSGVERMRQDLKEFAPNNAARTRPDPNVIDPNEMQEREAKRNLRLSYALDVAKVLAELGDRGGYELAVRMAFNRVWDLHRIKAAYVLVEIAKTSEETLAKENRDPASVLCAMAESEKNATVFDSITGYVEKLGGDIAARVLEKAISSPHQSELMRNVAKRRLERVRAKMKAASDKAND